MPITIQVDLTIREDMVPEFLRIINDDKQTALETEGEPDGICAEHMRQVSHYCVIDAVRCQQLLVRLIRVV
jgi:hypothetical protein